MTQRQRWTLAATIIGSGAVFLDSSVVNSALASIGRELPASWVGVLEGQAYVVSGYFATVAAFLILAGALSDYYGRKRVYSLGLVGFMVSSALCGLAPTLEWLVIFRLIQGATGAFLVPGALALITSTFDGAERGRAFGIWAAATAALNIVGPLVGGATVDTIGWRFAFLLNVPLLLFALWITRRHVAESRDTESGGRFDWLGAVVAALAVGGLAFGLIRGQAHAWSDTAAWLSIAIGGRGPDRLPDPDDQTASPAHPARAVPLARVHVDQRGDVLHLRRPVRHVRVPAARAPEHPRLHRARLERGRAAGRDHARHCSPRGSARSPDDGARGRSSPSGRS